MDLTLRKKFTLKNASMPAAKTKEKKIFVLDTSVIIYNHNAINTFDDNDVAIPITVLEELDNFKKGKRQIHGRQRPAAQ